MKRYPNNLSKLWRTKLRWWWNTYEWHFVICMVLFITVLGYIGFRKHLPQTGDSNTPWDLLYRTLQLFVIDSGSMESIELPIDWELNAARFLAPLITTYTAVQALAAIFTEQITSFRLRMLKDHIVICGLGRKGMLLTQSFLEQGENVVVIEQNEKNENIDWCKERGVTLICGNAGARETLEQVRVQKAKYVIALTKSDGVNAEISVHTRNIFKEHKGNSLTCLIHITDPQLCNFLKEAEIKSNEMDLFRLEFFSVFESGARILLNDYPAFDGSGSGNRVEPCLLIVGLGQMGGSLVVEAARRWNRIFSETGKRLKLILIDKDADQKSESLSVRYPLLKKICEIVPIQTELNSPEYQHGRFLFDANGECSITSVYVCIGEDSVGLSAALTLHQYLRKYKIPVVVRMNHNAGLATLLGEEVSGSFSNVYAFGILDRTCTPDLLFGGTHEILARAIHEEYVRDQIKSGKTPEMNPSMVSWDNLPEHLKESNRHQADHIGIKLKAIQCDIDPLTEIDSELFQFTPEELEKLSEMEHERWNNERLQDGWVYGEKKDVNKKITPYLVPWNKLSEEIKEYDRNTVRNLPKFLEMVGFRIHRVGGK